MTPKKNELWQLYRQREKEFESAKLKRTVLTILGFTVAYFCVFYIQRQPAGWEIAGEFILALFVAGLHFIVNAAVFGTLVQKGETERKILEDIKKEMDES